MYIILLEITALLAVILLPVLVVKKKFRKRSKPAYKIDTNTEYARYAINEDGFLEEINVSNLSKHKH
ncbi:hypothetical protein SNE25_11075 [Mucilaginibacter sabulilitoris]|uniref:Uncharacterized protein n=1 Tax=Mucilaginibacter sabulilitoris TaxID=1173583 RepID=A0ABZ0TSH3_9SPHI|nr:hypothetical protein [Mucilaginibacter sabulilitoris]WPU96062.1 hypothetical protein SNE25_11075 [Mucilaginibacter sabulilitoris]